MAINTLKKSLKKSKKLINETDFKLRSHSGFCDVLIPLQNPFENSGSNKLELMNF